MVTPGGNLDSRSGDVLQLFFSPPGLSPDGVAGSTRVVGRHHELIRRHGHTGFEGFDSSWRDISCRRLDPRHSLRRCCGIGTVPRVDSSYGGGAWEVYSKSSRPRSLAYEARWMMIVQNRRASLTVVPRAALGAASLNRVRCTQEE